MAVRYTGALVAIAAALAVVLAYVLGGPRMVWIVAAAEVALVMMDVARRFKVRAMHRRAAVRPEADHCEQCARARRRLEGRTVR
ncbi:hypothetical protein GCM10020229_19740 [Kitasatospora albolonga]|uniref:hypothetical protein n=1 Tax=Kitasatospora albolonga TaxID=68173 RepID=UPI0031F10531